jgi:hypothetical protein
MALTNISLSEITEVHLQGLIAAEAAESLYIEYKLKSYGGTDEQRKELLADISSFANAQGGDLVIGMTAARGVPTGFQAYTGDADSERLRLESMARDGLDPRISGLQTRAIALAGGGVAIVVRVPRGLHGPHRIIYKSSNRFWMRSSAGKFEPNVEELRQLFTAGAQRRERILAFHQERVQKILAGKAPVPISKENALLVMHVVPFNALDATNAVPSRNLSAMMPDLPPMARSSPRHVVANFEGFVGGSNADPPPTEQRAYVQLFRNGTVESVAALSSGVQMTMNLEGFIVRSAGLYANTLNAGKVGPPYVVVLSLVRAGDTSFVTGQYRSATPVPSDRDDYHFPEVVLPTAPTNDAETGPPLRPILDHLASLAGEVGTPTFDGSGQYTLRIPPRYATP